MIWITGEQREIGNFAAEGLAFRKIGDALRDALGAVDELHAVSHRRSQPGGEAIDTVVLACTHFPLVEAELRAAMGDGVQFVHGAEGIAQRIAHLTQGQPFRREIPDFALFTGDPDQFSTLLPTLRAYGLDRAERF